jgi:hypothetical protein
MMKFVATETAEQLDLQTLPRYASGWSARHRHHQ